MNPYFFHVVVSDEQPSPPKRTRTAATSTAKSATPVYDAKNATKNAASKPLKAVSQATATSSKSVTTKSATKNAAPKRLAAESAAATTQGTSQADAGNFLQKIFNMTETGC